MKKDFFRVLSLLLVLCVGLFVVAGCDAEASNESKFSALKSDKVESEKEWDQAFDSTAKLIGKNNFTLYVFSEEREDDNISISYTIDMVIKIDGDMIYYHLTSFQKGLVNGSTSMELYVDNEFVYHKNDSNQWIKTKKDDFPSYYTLPYLYLNGSTDAEDVLDALDFDSTKTLYSVNDKVIDYSEKEKGYVYEKKTDESVWNTSVVKFKDGKVVGLSHKTENSGDNAYTSYYSFLLDDFGETKITLPIK